MRSDFEIWREVQGYEGLYEVNNWGEVRNSRTGKVLRSQKVSKGYFQIALYKKGKVKRWFIHRLVAIAFIPNPNALPQVNHKDENKINNRVENLEWCTATYNINYGSHNERMKHSQKGKLVTENTKKKQSIPVAQYTKEGKLITIYYGAHEAERQTGINVTQINGCCNNKPQYKTAGGYIWKFA